MKRRTANDRMAECIIDMVHEYKYQIENLNRCIDGLKAINKDTEKKLNRAVDQANDATDKLGEIAEIIAEITDHTSIGTIYIYLSDSREENESKLKRLFKILDIPMTEAEIKEGDNNVED